MITIVKRAGILLGLCMSLNVAYAQTEITANDAPKYIGKTVDFLEMVSKVNFDPASRICIITFPDPRVRENSPEISIVIHNVQGAKHIHWLRSLAGNWLNVHGKLLIHNGKFIINGDDPHTKMSVFYGSIDPAPIDPGPPPPDTSHHK
ncbi:hypothetical protein SAMN05216490_2982 [Mucilaginibacter mallensis]|uniref:Uncharacterized protein n=1 Tax=Mucilaginibacter mallensis TaxID=652787 RepID=A0A1H1Z6T8_MUCMA|nr:hypothetical protein [Mucilaginibacter mallensis]SDT29232.1 hypothetical protein SAMN05216490_2982 [Mucilaginibacter mallensis]